MPLPRVDRLVTTGLARPIRRFFPLQSRGCIPILMYHRISEDPEPGISPYYRLNTSPARFAEQMQFLHRQNYQVVDLLHALDLIRNGALTHRHVVITFDDGYRDLFTHALPVLQKYRFPATVFLPTAYISDHRQAFRDTDCLTWAEVRSMRAQGIRFGSHTVTHPKLVQLDFSVIHQELNDSRRVIEQHLGEPVTTFAYPFAYPEADRSFTSRLSSLLAELGYQSCVTTRIGTAGKSDHPLALPRHPVNDCDDLSLFSAKLTGAYDWLAPAQRLRKWIRGSTRTPAPAPASPASLLPLSAL